MLKTVIISAAVPLVVAFVLSFLQMRSDKYDKGTEKKFTVRLAKEYAYIGLICQAVFIAIIFFAAFSENVPHWIIFVIFGAFVLLGLYITLKPLVFKVKVAGGAVFVKPLFGKTYSFSANDVTSVLRQVKKRNQAIERMVIKTSCGKKLVVESAMVNYPRFLVFITQNVKHERLTGFNN